MHRSQIVLLALLFLAAPSWAQDEDTAEDAAETTDTQAEPPSTPAEEVTDEEIEALLDGEDYLDGDEDDFLPSIEVRYEQSIPFPTDI
jgi:hypothetical protein